MLTTEEKAALAGIFMSACVSDRLWLHPNPLRATLFRKRYGVPWPAEGAEISVPNTENLAVLFNHVAGQMTAASSESSLADLKTKWLKTAWANDPRWARTTGYPNPGLRIRNNLGNGRRNSPYRIDVEGQEDEYGSCTYSYTRRFATTLRIPVEILEEACREEEQDILTTYIEENAPDTWEQTSESEYDYNNFEGSGSENQEVRWEEEDVDNLMTQFREDNPELFEEEEEEV